MKSIVKHTIPPIFNENSKILILGSTPSPKSREQTFYYAHPQNRSWLVLSALLGCDLPKTNQEKTDFLLEDRIALWDVLKSCSIEGADDSSISEPALNDLTPILQTIKLRAVFTTDGKAASFYRFAWLPTISLPLIPSPSTNPANRGRYLMEHPLDEYRVILPFLQESQPARQHKITKHGGIRRCRHVLL